MNVVESHNTDFGIVDYLVSRMTFDGQDTFRLMVEKFGQIRTHDLNISAAISGVLKVISAFESSYLPSNDNLKTIKDSVHCIQSQILSPEISQKVNAPTINADKVKISKIKIWLILETCNTLDNANDLLKYVGAFVCLSLSDSRVPIQTKNILFQLISYGKESLSEKSQKDLARLLFLAQQKFGASEKYFIQQVRTHYFFKNLYSSQKERQAVVEWHSMTKLEYLTATKKIYQDVTGGNLKAIVEALAVLLSLPSSLVLKVPFINNGLDDYIVAVDIERGVILFDLSEIFPDGAKPNGQSDLYQDSTSVLVKPLPAFLKGKLDWLISQYPHAKNIKELLFDIEDTDESQLINRLINTSAKFAINTCNMDPFDAAVLFGDFRSIPTSKTYYRRTTRQAIWSVSNRFFEEIGWGLSVEISDGLAFGSLVVVQEDVLSGLFANLSQKLDVLRPSNRCGIESLLAFHDQYSAFNATFTILCLALRNANPIGLLASDFKDNSRYVLVDDKHVLGAASVMPVVVTDSLSQQLVYWRTHCATMLKRLKRLEYLDQKFLALLNGVVEQKKSPLFFVAQKPYPLSVAQVAATWGVSLVENFSRHFWESKFNQVGVSSRFSSAHLRHQANGALSWASDSDFVLTTFIDTITQAQEGVLKSLNITPKYGIARRCI